MKTTKRNFGAWDAFVSFMEDIFYTGIIEESTSEFINFHWKEFQKMYF
jgi:gamma-glutamyl:cysteine ligase YbdK (ATP-grasp superfamily)